LRMGRYSSVMASPARQDSKHCGERAVDHHPHQQVTNALLAE
jgi:hypothetical protein